MSMIDASTGWWVGWLVLAMVAVGCLFHQLRQAPTVANETTPPEPVPEPPPVDHSALSPAEMVVLLDTYRKANVSLATQLGAAQERFDKLEALFWRQRAIDEQSSAARPYEQRAIDAEVVEILPPAPTRRSEP